MKKTLVLLSSLFVLTLAQSQTAPYHINQNTGKCCGGNNKGMGSSFLTLGSGQIDSVIIYPRTAKNSYDGTLYLYAGNGVNSENLIYEQPVNNVSGHLDDPYTIRLSSPVKCEADSVYTLYFTGFALRYGNSDTYQDGTLWEEGIESTNKDLDFIIYVGEVPVSTSMTDPKNMLSPMVRYDASSQSIVVSQNQIATDIKISVFNISGLLIKESNHPVTNVASIASGVYMVKVEEKNVVHSYKVVIP